jgi:hypothetical protein
MTYHTATAKIRTGAYIRLPRWPHDVYVTMDPDGNLIRSSVYNGRRVYSNYKATVTAKMAKDWEVYV